MMLDEYTAPLSPQISTLLTKLAGMMVVPKISTAQYFINSNKPLVDNAELLCRCDVVGLVVYLSKLPSPQISSPQYFNHSDKARWNDGRAPNLNSTVLNKPLGEKFIRSSVHVTLSRTLFSFTEMIRNDSIFLSDVFLWLHL